MPKRTNDFQQLIHLIYQQVAPVGATVHESALVTERNSSTQREVDILIEHTVAGVPISIAIECRDRGRQANVEWIDSLIGKFRDLPVHRIVAVSKSGFTPAAREKANANKIETRTLEEALRTDWPSQFLQIVMSRVLRYTRLNRVDIETADFIIEGIRRDDIAGKVHVYNNAGNPCGFLAEMLDDCFVQMVDPALTELTDNHGLEILNEIHGQDASLITKMRVPVEELFVKKKDSSLVGPCAS